jgi:hypothetical protein
MEQAGHPRVAGFANYEMKHITNISTLISAFGITAFTATGLFATLATAAGPDLHWQVRDHSAYGSAFVSDGCESTGVDIGGSESSSHSGGGAPVADNGAWAGYYSYNWCTGSQTSGWAWLPGGFSGDLQSASIDAVFEAESYEWVEVDGEMVYSYVGTRTVEINAEFTGVGKATHGMNSSMSRWGDSFSHSRWVGQSREATVDMSVTVDGQSIDLTNAIGSLGSANSGSISIYQ